MLDKARDTVSEWLYEKYTQFEVPADLWARLMRNPRVCEFGKRVEAEGKESRFLATLATLAYGAMVGQDGGKSGTRKRGHYTPTLLKYYEVWSFVEMMKAKHLSCRFFGTDDRFPRNWGQRYDHFLAAFDAFTGQPYEWRPASPGALQRAYSRAQRVFGPQDKKDARCFGI